MSSLKASSCNAVWRLCREPDLNQWQLFIITGLSQQDINARALGKLQWKTRPTNKRQCLSAGAAFSCRTFYCHYNFHLGPLAPLLVGCRDWFTAFRLRLQLMLRWNSWLLLLWWDYSSFCRGSAWWQQVEGEWRSSSGAHFTAAAHHHQAPRPIRPLWRLEMNVSTRGGGRS